MVTSSRTNEVVHSLVEVTRHADVELLNISISNALCQILKAQKVSLYSFDYNTSGIDCFFSLEVEQVRTKKIIHQNPNPMEPINYLIFKELVECFQSGEAVIIKNNDARNTIFYPITDKLNRVGAIFKIEEPSGNNSLEMSFYSDYLQVYTNYLNLLIDSNLDTLTGLLNRRTFDKDLKKIISEQRRIPDKKDTKGIHPMRRIHKDENSHWLAMIDIDFFKRVNDNFGHVYGDEVLLLIANIMRKTFRSVDILFRFGGEEFVVILRGINLAGAHNALERFRVNVEEYNFPQVDQITVSLGFVEISNRPIPTEILGFADEALYYSKENGRNQLNQYEKLIEKNLIHKRPAPNDDVEIF